MSYWDPGHPYRWRTWIRAHVPWVLIDLGVADKGVDCETVGGTHWWYNKDGLHSACYHCRVVRPGQLWRLDLQDEDVTQLKPVEATQPCSELSHDQ